MRHKKFYWDSCVFLGFLNQEKDKIDHVNALLEEAEEGNLTIYTSVASITEVLDCNRLVANKAREISWDNGLKPKDATHLSTAYHLINTFEIDLDEIHSFDNTFIERGNSIKGLCKCAIPQPNQSRMKLNDERKKPSKKKKLITKKK